MRFPSGMANCPLNKLDIDLKINSSLNSESTSPIVKFDSKKAHKLLLCVGVKNVDLIIFVFAPDKEL